MNHDKNRTYLCIDIITNKERTFDSINKAVKELGLSQYSLCKLGNSKEAECYLQSKTTHRMYKVYIIRQTVCTITRLEDGVETEFTSHTGARDALGMSRTAYYKRWKKCYIDQPTEPFKSRIDKMHYVITFHVTQDEESPFKKKE